MNDEFATECWGEYKLGDLFHFEPTKGVDSTLLVDGCDVPYIGAKHDAEGVIKMCAATDNQEYISEGNCIVFIMLGAGSAGYANYVKDAFIGMTGKTMAGYLKWREMTENIGLFLETVLCLERPKYSFGRSWSGDRLLNTVIKLPKIWGVSLVDWDFMDKTIESYRYDLKTRLESVL